MLIGSGFIVVTTIGFCHSTFDASLRRVTPKRGRGALVPKSIVIQSVAEFGIEIQVEC